MQRSAQHPLVTILVAALAASACGPVRDDDGDHDGHDAVIELEGSWDDDFGGTTIIAASKWGTSTIAKYDNAANWAILQSPADDPYSPNKFSKFVWTDPGADGWWYCTVDFNLDTLAAAEASTKTADASNPAESGCGGFAWTKMVTATPKVELRGTWDDNYGGTTEITASKWGTSTIAKFDNAANWAILQSPADDPYTPNEFSKFVWTEPSAQTWWYCTVDYGLDTREAAEASTKTADASNPGEGGCNGFPWTKMTRHAPAP